MATSKKTKIEDTTEEVIRDERVLIVKAAAVKDGMLNYEYEPLEGYSKGDLHKVKGAAIIHEDLGSAMGRLHVHLAHVDDAFQMAGVKIKDIDKFHDHELTELYSVTGFKIKGGEDDEKVILTGNKYLTVGGREELETPPVAINSFSKYKWWNELKAEVDNIRREVELYMDGKCTPVEDDDPVDPAQTKINFELPAGATIVTSEFEKAKV